jgi:dephospho-CoA kinase
VVGLAGGVGSGKSTVAALFRKWGARVVDADAIGHGVLGDPALRRRLVRTWGELVLRDGRIDRAALSRRVFQSPRSVARLNRMVHPAILRRIRRELRAARGWVVLDAALLFETGLDRLCDRVVFVDAPLGLRIRRTAGRGWEPGELRRRERFQWRVAYKKKKADYVLNNAGRQSHTERQARKIYDDLLGHP